MVLRTDENRLEQVRRTLVGMHELDVAVTLEAAKINYRIARRDQAYFVKSEDYDKNRLNIEIDEGIVTGITNG